MSTYTRDIFVHGFPLVRGQTCLIIAQIVTKLQDCIVEFTKLLECIFLEIFPSTLLEKNLSHECDAFMAHSMSEGLAPAMLTSRNMKTLQSKGLLQDTIIDWMMCYFSKHSNAGFEQV